MIPQLIAFVASGAIAQVTILLTLKFIHEYQIIGPNNRVCFDSHYHHPHFSHH